MTWQTDAYDISRLWQDLNHLATIFPEGDRWTWRVFVDTLNLDDDGSPSIADREDLEAWGFGNLICARINFTCLEGKDAGEETAKYAAESIIAAVRRKAAEARGLRLAEHYPSLGQPALEARPTMGQVARSIYGPLLRPVLSCAKWSLLAMVVIFVLHKIGLLDEWAAAVLMPTFLVAIAFVVLEVKL